MRVSIDSPMVCTYKVAVGVRGGYVGVERVLLIGPRLRVVSEGFQQECQEGLAPSDESRKTGVASQVSGFLQHTNSNCKWIPNMVDAFRLQPLTVGQVAVYPQDFPGLHLRVLPCGFESKIFLTWVACIGRDARMKARVRLLAGNPGRPGQWW